MDLRGTREIERSGRRNAEILMLQVILFSLSLLMLKWKMSLNEEVA